jgi:hypothetical protein
MVEAGTGPEWMRVSVFLSSIIERYPRAAKPFSIPSRPANKTQSSTEAGVIMATGRVR